MNGRQATDHAQLLTQFRQGGIGVLADEFQQTTLSGLVQLVRTAAAMRFGVDRSGLALALPQADDYGHVDTKQDGELPQGISAAFHSRHDTFAQIVGKSETVAKKLGSS